MKKIVLSALFLLGSYATFAQYSETISSGRPGQAISPTAVGKNVFQIQAGADYYETDKLIPNSTFRFGVTETFELNSSVSYSAESEEFQGVSLGTRIRLFEGENVLPTIGLQATVSAPVDDFENPGYSLLFIASQNLDERLAYTFNVGADFNKDVSDGEGKFVFNLSYSLSDKFSVFVEPYGVFDKKMGESYFQLSVDYGLAYLVNNDLQLDILAGKTLTEGDDYMFGAGISWRFLTKKRAE